MPPRARSRRRPIAIGLALLGLTGLGLGSAAQLNLEADTLGAGVTVVGSCQGETPIQVGFTTEFAVNQYVVTDISLSGIHTRCIDKSLKLTLMDASDGVLHSEGPVPVESDTVTIDLENDTQPAEAITQIAVVIAD